MENSPSRDEPAPVSEKTGALAADSAAHKRLRPGSVVTTLVLGVILLAIGAWSVYAASQASTPTKAELNQRAPEIRLPILENGKPGRFESLDALRGRPVVLNFWATWCAPCRAEFPALDAAYRKYRDDKGLVVIGVDVQGDLGPQKVQEFIGEMGVIFPIWLTTDYGVEDAYRIQALPTTVFIDRQGIIRQVKIGGPLSLEAIEKELEKIF